MMDGKNSTSVGKFEFFEISEPSPFEKGKKKAYLADPLGLTAAESDFLFASLGASLVVIADRKKKVRVIITALYRTFRVLLAFTPSRPFSTSDLYSMTELHGTIEISSRALEIIKERSGGNVDFGGRVDRLLNLDHFLARGTERKRCYRDMIDNVNVFAKNAAHLCGIELTLGAEYPEPVLFERFDYALLGALMLEEFVKGSEGGPCRVHVSFLLHKDAAPFVDMRFSCLAANEESLIMSIAQRLNMPIRISGSETGAARILFSPVRPDFSVLELKQALALGVRGCDLPCDDDRFPE